MARRVTTNESKAMLSWIRTVGYWLMVSVLESSLLLFVVFVLLKLLP